VPDRRSSQGWGDPRSSSPGSPPARPFRNEAVAHLARGGDERPLVWTPVWTHRSLSIVGLLLTVGLVSTPFLTLTTTVDCVSLLRGMGEVRRVAPVSAVIASLDVVTGQRIRRGDVLVRLAAGTQHFALRRLETEYREALARRLHDPSDAETATGLLGLRSALAAARSELEERTVRSSIDGWVSAVHAQVGQAVVPGQVLVDLSPRTEGLTVLIAVPGPDSLRLRKGLRARLVIDGLPDLRVPLTLDALDPAILGEEEAVRLLALPIHEPVAIARATVDHLSWRSGTRWVELRPGMQGRVTIETERRSLVRACLEWLRPASSP
jgi:multidrug efflux pump subunit AcrA (membrane-fusion protein)